jgi:hypothetical protein
MDLSLKLAEEEEKQTHTLKTGMYTIPEKSLYRLEPE